MTDNLRVPRRLEGEQEVNLNTSLEKSRNNGINSLDHVSLEAVINVLIQRRICTEAELLAEENRLRNLGAPAAEERVESVRFTPVQTYSHRYQYEPRDSNSLRRWAAKRRWSRRLGTILFGWKWHRKKRAQNI
ncbi:MAG: hypothetical protein ONB46_23540 [candidate division KSB1 bacterium]|nr:hypothetical protein [candidate division KSB1 bacterium]MDZ7368840.1 hypothetical protein [candidate division KSB1 bacterium]MDZ7407416.1 hypothetical protein [candidate division KSB1 bacterium]